ncbi:MAG TPA: patatin-like phospholipase family protein [Sphingomonas sp.]|nr:patatin-like phospholipase family protein [Sphingomonas sp.]
MRALILSGGGPLAVAWEAGVIAGLAESGIELGEADFILGTSAGGIVGVQLAAGRPPADIAAAIVNETVGIAPSGATTFAADAIAKLPEMFALSRSRPDDPAAARAEVGDLALAAPADSELNSVARFAAQTRVDAWPERPFGCVAVDAVDGSVRVLTRDCGASPAHAVAASCSLPGLVPPITIGGRRYIDGGFASTANVDLLPDYERLLVLAFRPPGPAGDAMESHYVAQAAAVRHGGADVLFILPNDESQSAIGTQTMEMQRRPEVVRAAMAQGRAEAERIEAFWQPGGLPG